jgi:hypothetical protein
VLFLVKFILLILSLILKSVNDLSLVSHEMLVNCCPKLIGGTVYFDQVDSGIESDKELLFGKTLESKHALWYNVSILSY